MPEGESTAAETSAPAPVPEVEAEKQPSASPRSSSESSTDGDNSQSPENGDGDSDSPKGPSEDDRAPSLPSDDVPPLPSEPPPTTIQEDDGWQALWSEEAQAFYFYNSLTGETTWTNPRIPEATSIPPTLGLGTYDRIPDATNPELPTEAELPRRPHGGYDPSIHGSYDPSAPYAQPPSPPPTSTAALPAEAYAATAAFNRFTGRFQPAAINPELHNDENKSRRQMGAFFDVDAAANSHDGRSLKAERSGKKLSRKEVKQFKEKRRERKEERRRAWLRD